MDNFPESLKITDAKLNGCIRNIQNAVQNIWEQQLHKHYTKHGIDHSEKIVAIIGDLLTDNIDMLNEYERFVLLAAIFLHDIGMQFPEYSGLEKKVDYSCQELNSIRENHHEASAKLILDSVSSKCDISLGLEQCKEYAEFIAEVSRYHRKLPLGELKDKSFLGKDIRVPLLAALLRIGDELHVDFSRVNMTILKMWDIPIESKFHWWSHHYVQSVSCKKGIPVLHFRFPRGYENNRLIEVIINKIRNSIQKEFSNVYDILYHYNLKLYREVKINENHQYSDGVEPIPKDLYKYIKENILETEDSSSRLSLVTSVYWVIDGAPYSDDGKIVKSMSRIIKFIANQNNIEAIKEIEAVKNLIMAPREKMVFYGIAGNCYFIIGQLDKSEEYFKNALEISDRNDLKEIYIKDVSAIKAAALGNLGYIYIIRGNPEKGINNFMEALKITNAHGYKIGEAVLLNNIGWLFAEQGKTGEAYKYLNQAVELNRVSGYQQGEAKALGSIGHLLHMEGKTTEGLDCIQKSLNINKQVNNLEGMASDYGLLGVVYQNIGRHDEALKNYKKALILHKKIGFKLGMINDIGNIAMVYRLKKEVNKAMKLHNLAMKFSREIGYIRGEGVQLHGLGNIYKDMGNLDKAMECYNEGLDKFRVILYKQGIATLLTNIGAIHRKKSDFDAALEVYKESLNISREIGLKQGQSKTLSDIGSMYIEQKDYKQALNYFSEALQIDKEINNQLGEAICLENIGFIYLKKQQFKETLKYLHSAVAIYDKISPNRMIDCLNNIAYAYFNELDYKKGFEFIVKIITLTEFDERIKNIPIFSIVLEDLINKKDWKNLKEFCKACESVNITDENAIACYHAIFEAVLYLETKEESHKKNYVRLYHRADTSVKTFLDRLFGSTL